MNAAPKTWSPDLSGYGKPLFRAIAACMERDIASGALLPGDRLPPVRELADRLGLNPSTVAQAYRLATEKGLLNGTVGKGSFVAHTGTAVHEDYDPGAPSRVIDLGIIQSLGIYDPVLRDELRRIARSLHIDEYFTGRGAEHIARQRLIGKQWLKRFGYHADEQNVVVSFGTQNALTIILTSLFGRDDKIGTDIYTYYGLKHLVRMLGIRLVPIAMDDGGISAEGLDKACRNEGIKGVFIIPQCHNPTTHTLGLERRREVAGVLKRHGTILIEDAIYDFLGNTDSPPISSLLPEQSIYISGTSKALTPDLRVAFMGVPECYRQPILNASYGVSLMNSTICVDIIGECMRSGLLDAIINAKRTTAGERSALSRSILSGHTLFGNQRDFFQWLVAPNGIDAKQFEARALAAGVRVYAADTFSVGEYSPQPAIRLSLSAAKNTSELARGLGIVRTLLDDPAEVPGIII